MIHYKIPSVDFLRDTHIPVTIFAGTSDWVIPLRCAVKLKGSLKPTDRFIEIKGAGHNDLNHSDVYFKEMKELLK